MDGLKASAMESLIAIHMNDKTYGSRLENLKNHLTSISKDHEKRVDEINKNTARYVPAAVLDQRAALDKMIRNRVEELLSAHGFEKEILAAEKEMVVPAPANDTQELIQLLKEQELRKAMTAAGAKFQGIFGGEIFDGDPAVISAIENSPVPFPLDDGVLEDGKRRRLEILNPIATKKLQGLKAAQSTLDAMAQQVMPFGSKHDLIADLAKGATD